MKVYIVCGGWNFEGFHVLKCFTSKDAAEKHVQFVKNCISDGNDFYDYVKILEKDLEE
jgi:hypothetical protein